MTSKPTLQEKANFKHGHGRSTFCTDANAAH